MSTNRVIDQNNQAVMYGDNYSTWKGWREENFGQITPAHAAMYKREMKRAAKAKVDPIKCVLEIGFGNGTFLRYCRDAGLEIHGTEAGEDLVDIARKHGYKSYHAVDIATLPDEKFDLIAAFDVLEHIPHEQVEGFLHIIKTKLKNDGIILFRFPNADTWLGNQNYNGDPTHVTAMGNKKLEYFCNRTQLKIHKFLPEARLGFDGGLAKGIHKLLAGPIVTIVSWIVKAIYFPRSKMVLSSANVVAIIVK